MKTYKVVIVLVILFCSSCKYDEDFFNEPEIVLELIERMEREDTGFELSVFVEYTARDSVLIQYYLTNNKTIADTISSSSGFPTRIPYRYGEELINIFARNRVYPDDENFLALPAGDSILLSEWHRKRLREDNYLIRGVFEFTLPDDKTDYWKTDYWLISEPVLVKGVGN